MWSHRDLGWWGFWIGLVALVLAFPLSLLANMITPVVQNWIAKRGLASLVKRIATLEAQLAEFEKDPAIDEVDDHILWGLKRAEMTAIGVGSTVMLVLLFAVEMLTDANSERFKVFATIVLIGLLMDLALILRLRYERDFRYFRSPRSRKAMRTAIEELKKIRDSW